MGAQRLELLRELVPAATRVAVLVNPADAENTETTLRDVEAAARAMGLQIQVLNASTSREIDSAFATVVRERPDAFFVGPGAFFVSRRIQLANLAARSGIPATYPVRDNVEAGGMMSYGPSLTDAYRQARNWRTCRWCNQASSSLSSTHRPPGCSVSPCRRRCSPALMR